MGIRDVTRGVPKRKYRYRKANPEIYGRPIKKVNQRPWLTLPLSGSKSDGFCPWFLPPYKTTVVDLEEVE